MRCATPIVFYAFTSPTGNTRVQVDAFTFGVDGAACTNSQFVVMTRSEAENLAVSPFYLDVPSAVAIGGATLTLMAVAAVLRFIRKTLESPVTSTFESD